MQSIANSWTLPSSSSRLSAGPGPPGRSRPPGAGTGSSGPSGAARRRDGDGLPAAATGSARRGRSEGDGLGDADGDALADGEALRDWGTRCSRPTARRRARRALAADADATVGAGPAGAVGSRKSNAGLLSLWYRNDCSTWLVGSGLTKVQRRGVVDAAARGRPRPRSAAGPDPAGRASASICARGTDSGSCRPPRRPRPGSAVCPCRSARCPAGCGRVVV